MIHTMGWVIWLFAYLFSRLPMYWRALWLQKKGRIAERDALASRQVYLWTSRLLKNIKMDVTVKGQENLPKPGEVVMFCANHQSYLDIPVLLCHLGTYPLMARQEVGRVPLLAGWMRVLGCIYVNRDDARGAVAGMKKAGETLKSGHSLIVFPEGTRSKGDVMGEFMPGAVRIASREKVPIVPVAIDGSYKGLEMGGSYNVRPAKVTLTILPKIPTDALDKAGTRALPQQLQQQIATALGPKSLPQPTQTAAIIEPAAESETEIQTLH